jgi:hypothetical protein
MALPGQIRAYLLDLVFADDESLSSLDTTRVEQVWSLWLYSHKESL